MSKERDVKHCKVCRQPIEWDLFPGHVITEHRNEFEARYALEAYTDFSYNPRYEATK